MGDLGRSAMDIVGECSVQVKFCLASKRAEFYNTSLACNYLTLPQSALPWICEVAHSPSHTIDPAYVALEWRPDRTNLRHSLRALQKSINSSNTMAQPSIGAQASRLARDFTLNGVARTRMPKLVYGTAWKKDRTTDLVYTALKTGFRGIDTAAQPKHYNEQGVAAGFKRAVSEGIVKREDVFVSPDDNDVTRRLDPNLTGWESRFKLNSHRQAVRTKTHRMISRHPLRTGSSNLSSRRSETLP